MTRGALIDGTDPQHSGRTAAAGRFDGAPAPPRVVRPGAGARRTMRAVRRFLHSGPARLMLAATLTGACLWASSLSDASANGLPLLTYISGLGTNNPPSVWLADADGTSPVVLGQATSALLSPDGTQVAALNKVKATSTLSLYPVGGGSPTVLTTAKRFMQLLAWSADAKLLLVLIGGGASGQLVVFDVATHTNTTVASGVFDNASFQPGGSDQVVYALANKS